MPEPVGNEHGDRKPYECAGLRRLLGRYHARAEQNRQRSQRRRLDGGGRLLYLRRITFMANNAQRGKISADQVRGSSRNGNGVQIQMFGGSAPVAGHAAVFDANGNVVDGGSGSGGS